MTDSFLKYLLATLILVVAVEGLANAQNSDPITAVRIDGRPDTAAFDPLIDESTFTSAGISGSRFNAGGKSSRLRSSASDWEAGESLIAPQ